MIPWTVENREAWFLLWAGVSFSSILLLGSPNTGALFVLARFLCLFSTVFEWRRENPSDILVICVGCCCCFYFSPLSWDSTLEGLYPPYFVMFLESLRSISFQCLIFFLLSGRCRGFCWSVAYKCLITGLKTWGFILNFFASFSSYPIKVFWLFCWKSVGMSISGLWFPVPHYILGICLWGGCVCWICVVLRWLASNCTWLLWFWLAHSSWGY